MYEPIRITDPGDARIAAYRDIRERDLVGRHGRFVAEGRVVLRALLQSDAFETESVLVLENRVAGLAGELALKPEGVPLYVASGDVFDAIAGFPMHRGILAIGRRPMARQARGLLPPGDRNGLLVACVGIANHDNIGAIFRNAAAFGVDAVILDETCCDPLYRKALRVSVGAVLKVPFSHGGSGGEIVKLLAEAKIEALSMSPSGGRLIDAVEPGGRKAIVLGTEGEGLPKDVLAATDPVRIAMTPGFDSLNVAAASAIALHHLALAKNRSGPYRNVVVYSAPV
ncbi:MAG: RNA methyltransferase [Rhizobiaceae bacterium]